VSNSDAVAGLSLQEAAELRALACIDILNSDFVSREWHNIPLCVSSNLKSHTLALQEVKEYVKQTQRVVTVGDKNTKNEFGKVYHSID
jgi:hypothetical protein